MQTATTTSRSNTRRAPTEAQKATARARRAELKALSDLFKPVAKLTGCTINELILEHYQAETGQSDFRSFPAWKAEGQAPRKGEKGFAIWGRPRAIRSEGAANAEPGELCLSDLDKPEFFPLAYLFHAGQVAPIGHKDPAPTSTPDQDPAESDEQSDLFSEVNQ